MDYFIKRGHKVTELCGDFSHQKKETVKIEQKNVVPVPVKPYKKNMSATRLISHMRFAKDAVRRFKESDFDLVYTLIPPNISGLRAARYCKKNNVKIIVDIIDMWPESLPVSKFKRLLLSPALFLWKRFRSKALKKADAVIFECGLYKNNIPERLYDKKPNDILYLCKPGGMSDGCATGTAAPAAGIADTATDPAPADVAAAVAPVAGVAALPVDAVGVLAAPLNIAYLGSINSLIDVDYVAALLKQIKKTKDVRLKIIGGGENKARLLELLRLGGVAYADYGAVFDERQKVAIFSDCAFALNIYKTQPMIGLTYKSIDYFSYGLPVINSIKCDTYDIIERYGCGINIAGKDVQEVADLILAQTPEQLQVRKAAVRLAFGQNFSVDIIGQKLDKIIGEVL
jgi:glycosyltransferase involved in cell wall biosynthesis